jgi:GTPase SAR1 family protein
MKISLLGSHGVGKSTLVREFIKKHPEYTTPKQEESRIVVSKGLGINFETTLESQKEFQYATLQMMSDIQNISNVITPRNLIDLCAYNLYFFRRPKYGLTQEFVDNCRDIMLRYSIGYMKAWDLFAYIPIEFPITEENKYRVGQKDSPEYQVEVDTYIQALLMNYNIPYITITGTVEERITKIEEYIKRV